MPLIEIKHAQPFTPEAEAGIIQAVTDAYATASGADPSKVWVILEEVPRHRWGSGGTTLAARDSRNSLARQSGRAGSTA
jgi:4-oxalocrotonate tautomerase